MKTTDSNSLQSAGKLEYHVPAHYTQDRPPMNYTHSTEALPISQHHLGASLPHVNGKLQVLDDTGHFRVLTDAESNTTVLEDWIYTDKAQLGLHIINFEDATLVTITWLHTLLDAMGRHALLRAWQAVLEGREDDVPEFIGYDSDPLAKLGSNTAEEFVLKDKLLGRFSMARFIFNFIWEAYFYPVEEGRMVCMPASYFAKIKAQAFADLATLDKSKLTINSTTGKPFLSDGDILTAWFMRLITRTNPSVASSPARTITVMNVFGMRDLMRTSEPPLLPKNGAYIHNCVTAMLSLFTVRDFTTWPLGHVAAQIRADLVTQGTRPQIEAGQRLAAANGGMAMYGTGDMALSTMTNWTKAKLFETDFSSAIVKEAVRQGNPKARGKPRYIHPFATASKGLSVRGSGNCVGVDADGNIWMGALLRKENVPAFVRAVEDLAVEKGDM
jgi:hypothetical protein